MFEKVRDIIVDTLSCEMDEVTMEASLSDDLGADSLDAEDRPNMKTVGDIVRYLEALEGTKDNRI